MLTQFRGKAREEKALQNSVFGGWRVGDSVLDSEGSKCIATEEVGRAPLQIFLAHLIKAKTALCTDYIHVD